MSTHTSHVVGSVLADPYMAFTAGINGLAGPKHGLASLEVMEFLLGMKVRAIVCMGLLYNKLEKIINRRTWEKNQLMRRSRSISIISLERAE